MKQLTHARREREVMQGFVAACDAFESGCNCDLCRLDDQQIVMESHDEDCECRDCVGHDDDCRCDECYDERIIKADRMSDAEADNIWRANQIANARMANLMGFDDEEESK